MIKNITIRDFFKLAIVLADVRTPAEFAHGHIPGAFNLPLFSNEERVLVGTTYKQIGREQAILLGFDLTGPKWSGFIKDALLMAPDKKIAVHCWRGGMRSGAMAWALDLYGFEVYLIEGGYKRYRRWVLDQFEQSYQLVILGGMTGSGKTRILQQLQNLDQQMIDLEELAQHQGSSFGTMNKMVQPTQEQFENNLAYKLKDLDISSKIWLEDESHNIGKLSIPNPLWKQMTQAILIDLIVDLNQRVANLVKEYGQLDKEFLISCTERIHKRLGPVQTKNAIAAIKENRMEEFIRFVLVYYDKTYRTSLSKRQTDHVLLLDIARLDPAANASQILNFSNTIPPTPVQ
ncbi:tRNA 2-selenouridine(34) synthase MnmH [Dyadobacter frigoris]|uniref:tRNA 2-selenouridine(34) synthase MnmH n=1 Tax=Dyadobacter frigoris TaxID=2576211 RepID=A0A4U6CWP3_9BACT|nr:tRNA 2-selenouridine(34) synthase MnmH [Dyadobacter frigoris]TKT87618.1 tRNA 2-selenouridine(34) synthase MnmH [Dyadobacter frigoris]GLU52678.1 tRNA 2-selenouridine(34) synthase MnmH [Dyadobacter frigoris]